MKEQIARLGGTFIESPEGLLVDLSKRPVTDDDLAALGDLSSVSSLVLVRTGITNAGLIHLRSATKLAILDLSNTQVSDAGLEQLKSLPLLNDIILLGCEVSEVAVEGLQKAKPQATIACDAPWAVLKGSQ